MTDGTELKIAQEEKKKILRQRALELAKEPEEEKADTAHTEVVEFLLADERYGIELPYVKEIYPLKDFTVLPCVPYFIFGIVNARGQIISVIDIKRFFELPEKGLSNLNKVIVVRSGKIEFGIRADEVIGIKRIYLNEVQSVLPTLTGIRAEYLKAVTDDLLVVLDMEKLLSDKKLIINEEVE